MYRSAINKLQFDFTCSSETVAKELQREISYYGLPDLQGVMEQVFVNSMEGRILEIDKIEIDLGDITLKGLNDEALLARFRTALESEIEKIRNERQDYIDPQLREWIIIKTYLLYGDLPWWVDKNTSFSMSRLISGLLAKAPETLWRFLESNSQNLGVQERIHTQLSVNIRKRLEGNPAIFSRKERKYDPVNFDAIINVLNSDNEVDISSYLKMLITHAVCYALDVSSMPILQSLGVLSAQDLSLANEFITGNQTNTQALYKILDQLSLLALEFVLQATVLKSNKGRVVTEEKRKDWITPLRSQKIKFISSILQCTSPDFLQEMDQYSDDELLVLEGFLMQHKLSNAVKSRLIALLVDHPYFLHYGLLLLPVTLSEHLNGSVEYLNQFKHPHSNNPLVNHQNSLHAVFGKMGEKDLLILNDILQKGNCRTEAERLLLYKQMHKLPISYLQTLARITVLDKADIEVLVGNEYTRATDALSEANGLEQDFRKIIIENAGLVLIAAYLPAIFNNLGYTEGGKFKNIITRSRALYLLQYIATGKQYSPEYVLQLNKLLCGFLPQDAIAGYKRKLTKKEKEEASSLVSAIIGHWKALKGTSPDGFRTAFIQRKGLLVQNEVSWVLQVEKRSYDVLLDSIPWSFSVMKLPWMIKSVESEW
jgi:hypothetical protein